MARLALITVAALPWIAACSSSGPVDDRFSQPNSLMEAEIHSRVADIQYQHREELFNNLLWLVQAGEQAIPALLESKRHPDSKVRANVAWVIAQIGDRRVIADLQEMIRDQDPTVRLEVARSLVRLGDISYCPALIDALDSDRVQVRYMCHEALKNATGRDFGFDHLTDDVAARRQAVLHWREWWSELSGDRFFAQAYAEQHGLTEPAEQGMETGAQGIPAGPPGGAETMPKTMPEPPFSPPERGDG